MISSRKKKKVFINPLLQGCESQKRFDAILGLTSIRSKPIIEALRKHYVDGLCEDLLAVDSGNYKRAKDILGWYASEIERVKDMDWVKRNGNS